MRRPTMSLLCLIAALAGAPLRQGEAADDLARSMAEAGPLVEATDGGVGDDAGLSVLKGVAEPRSAPMPSTTADRLPIPSDAPSPLVERGADRTATLPAGQSRHHAWLQRFLF